jgi:Family of unknown function (DUF6232)
MPAIAYIKTDCEHCDGSIEYPSELAGESIECPHCQQTTTLPTPFMPPPPAAPQVSPPRAERPTRQGDEVLFSEDGILVSKTRFVVDSQIFALANISSVRGDETPPSRTAPVLFLLIGFAIFAASVWFGIVVIAACIAWMCFQKSKFSVVLTAAGGEVTAYSSYDRAFIGRTIEAVTGAIVARG